MPTQAIQDQVIADMAAIEETAYQLTSKQRKNGYSLEAKDGGAIHLYKNSDGSILYAKLRMKHPSGEKWIRPLCRDKSGSWKIGEPAFPCGKPLYNLDQIVARPSDRVKLVEGEYKADLLMALGILATTSGGASSDVVTDFEPLAGREIWIGPDNDRAGQDYAQRVAIKLLALDCTISVIDVAALDLPEKGDCVDWLKRFAKINGREATAEDIWTLPLTTEPLKCSLNDSNSAVDATLLPTYEAITLCAADVIPEPISWLWNGWLAAGKLHILAGAPGTGKTTLTLGLAAILSTAGRWPDGSKYTERGNVLIWSGEDDPVDTLVPRLNASGADLNRVHFLTGTRDLQSGDILSFDPSRDIPAIEAVARRIGGVSMLIIDPIVSVTGNADSHKNAEVRKALQPIIEIGQLLGCCIIGISHFSKGTQGRDPTERVTGSLAFGALARVVLAAAKLSEDDGGGRLLCRTKSNIGADHGGIKYELLEKETTGGIFASYAAWGECVEGSARELLDVADDNDHGEKSGASEAADLLKDLLADGAVLVKEATRTLKENGFTDKQIRRAREKLNVVTKRTGLAREAKNYWILPQSCPLVPLMPTHAQSLNVGKLGMYGAEMGKGSLNGADSEVTSVRMNNGYN